MNDIRRDNIKFPRLNAEELASKLKEACEKQWTQLHLFGSDFEEPEDTVRLISATHGFHLDLNSVFRVPPRCDLRPLDEAKTIHMLSLVDCGVNSTNVRIVFNLKQLTLLNLWSNDIGAEGAKAIAASLRGLTSLDLAYNGIGRLSMALRADEIGRDWT